MLCLARTLWFGAWYYHPLCSCVRIVPCRLFRSHNNRQRCWTYMPMEQSSGAKGRCSSIANSHPFSLSLFLLYFPIIFFLNLGSIIIIIIIIFKCLRGSLLEPNRAFSLTLAFFFSPFPKHRNQPKLSIFFFFWPSTSRTFLTLRDF